MPKNMKKSWFLTKKKILKRFVPKKYFYRDPFFPENLNTPFFDCNTNPHILSCPQYQIRAMAPKITYDPDDIAADDYIVVTCLKDPSDVCYFDIPGVTLGVWVARVVEIKRLTPTPTGSKASLFGTPPATSPPP